MVRKSLGVETGKEARVLLLQLIYTDITNHYWFIQALNTLLQIAPHKAQQDESCHFVSVNGTSVEGSIAMAYSEEQ